jgi:hypothetical protein
MREGEWSQKNTCLSTRTKRPVCKRGLYMQHGRNSKKLGFYTQGTKKMRGRKGFLPRKE